jgi:hypothetical protein
MFEIKKKKKDKKIKKKKMKTMNRRLLMMTIAALGLSSVYAGQECSAGITCPANTAVSAALFSFP